MSLFNIVHRMTVLAYVLLQATLQNLMKCPNPEHSTKMFSLQSIETFMSDENFS
jgi:hypothetical protein